MPKLKDMIPGGKADDMTLAKIAKKHGVNLSEIEKEFKMGMKVEREHSDNPEKKKEVTMDHLFDTPKYYTKLKAAGLADELDESQVSNMYIEIGEIIENMENEYKKLKPILHNMIKDKNGMINHTRLESMYLSEIEAGLKGLKKVFSQYYDFNWKK